MCVGGGGSIKRSQSGFLFRHPLSNKKSLRLDVMNIGANVFPAFFVLHFPVPFVVGIFTGGINRLINTIDQFTTRSTSSFNPVFESRVGGMEEYG